MFRLPDGWGRPTELDDLVVAAGLRIRRAGIVVRSPYGEEISGAAADPARPVLSRAWFELAERVCVVEWCRSAPRRQRLFTEQGDDAGALTEPVPRSPSPRRWIPSRSNGVALHRTWLEACERAAWELAERDRVLRAWVGEIVPRPIAAHAPLSPRRYEWIACSFPVEEATFSEGLEVVGVFAFPREAGVPLAMGFAARPDLDLALGAATSEALQQLAFLWGVPRSRPSTAPGPGLHLDTFQARRSHGRLRAWLDGGHRAFARSRRRVRRPAPVRFLDLTGPWLEGRARVAKAICRDAMPLDFGKSPEMRHLPPDLRIHPIA